MRKPVLLAILTSLLLLALAAPVALAGRATSPSAAPLAQAGTCDGGEGVYLYADTNYRGRCIKLTADTPDLGAVSFNNIASSIRFIGDWTATLYVDQNYGGLSSVFTRDDADLSNNTIGADRASAVRVGRGTLPPENVCDGEGVYLYEGTNYTGRCIRFTGDVPDLSVVSLNNVVSSIRIVGDWTATLYVDQNFNGASTNFTRDDPDLSNNTIGNDRASSLRARPTNLPAENACDGGEGAYLYEHPNFQGRCVKFTGDAPDLRTLGFDDTASSLRVLGNWSVTLYRDLSGNGLSSGFNADDSNLGDNPIGDNQATSVRVVRLGGPPVESNCDGGEGVYLYEHPNYQGRCVKFLIDVPDLRVPGFDDTASSIRIVGGWTATLYRDLSGAGLASTFTGDDANLADDAIGDNQVTSIRVVRVGGPVSNCDGGEGVYLYEHPSYQGRCVKFVTDVPDLRVPGFDDTASSISIIGNWTVTLYRDLNGTGISSTFTGPDWNLADDGIGDNQATSIRLTRR